MIRTVWVDDEKDARFLLHKALSTHFTDQLELIGDADGVGTGLSLIHRTKPDLVFLDIQMRDGTGFDLLEKLEHECEIIFLTAFDNFAIRAFKYSAFDYLLKPIKLADLRESIDRLTLTKGSNESKKSVLDDALKGVVNKINVRGANGIDIIVLDDLIRIESENQYTKLYTNTKTILSSKNLKHYTELLEDNNFVRVHNRHLVNEKHIIKAISSEVLEVVLSNNESVPVSRANKKKVNDLLR